MSRICSLKLSNLSLAQAVGSAGLWVIGAALCPVSPAGHTFEWADTGQRLCVQIRGYAFFPPKSSKLLLTDESSTPFSESPSLSLSISKAQLTWWRRSYSVPLHFLASVKVLPSTKLCFFFCFFFCAETLITEERFTIFYLTTFIFTLLPSSSLPTSDLFLSPPSSHSWKSISGHTIRAERGGEEEFAGLGLHLDAQKGRSCCEELLFGMSAAPCSNVPVYHHCDYVRWLGWPLHHGRLKCGPRVPLDEILALNPSYKHCLPREGFFLFLPLSLSSHFFAFSYSFKRPSSLDHSFCILQLFFVIFASVWCGTGISKAPVSSSSTLY